MENSNIIEKLLNPVYRQYKKNKIVDTLINSINKCLIVVLIWLALQIILKLLIGSAESYFYITNVIMSAGIIVYLCTMTIATAVNKISNTEVALIVDKATNPHDIIVSGLEYEMTGRNSDFALFSISKASSILSSFEVAQLRPNAGPLKYKAAFLALFFIAVYVLIPDCVVLSNKEDFVASNQKKADSQLKSDKSPAIIQNDKTDGDQVVRERSYFIAANANSQMAAGDSNYVTIGNQENSRAFASNQSLSRKKDSDNKANEFQEDSFQVNSEKAASSSHSNLSESNVKTGDLYTDSVDQDNQLDSESNDKREKANNNSTGRSPMLDDNASAPGRELGRAGKKNGKPGNGRGGLGSVKKSRATASIVAGKPVPVFIKSRQNKGRSKSIILNSPPGRNIDREMILPDGVQHESAIDKSVVSEEMQTLVTNYFKELTEYANRKHESSTRQDK